MFSPIVRSSSPVVQSTAPITLIGGGQATRTDLHKALKLAPLCVAADGGAGLALEYGVDLEAVIGDFDSVTPEVLARVPPARQHKVTEQDSTDFEKALSRIVAPVVVGVGFLGGRIDHQLAAFHTLAATPAQPCVLLGETEVICLAPPHLELPTQAGDVVSLFPLALVSGRSTGLRWPIDGLAFEPGSRIGTSNIALGPMSVAVSAPGMLLVLPDRLMPALVAALASPTAARWPVRAE